MTRTINAAGLALVKAQEGLRLEAYADGGGVWTIGYGHTGGVKPGDVISSARAEMLLEADLLVAEEAVTRLVMVPLSDNQFAALVDFVLNEGEGAIKAAQAKAVTQIVDRQSRITLRVSQSFDAVKISDAAATQKLVQEIPSHVSQKADADCPVPLGFVRVFNSAAHGPVPQAAAGADDTPSGAQLSDVARGTVQNDGQYDQVADQLKALQDWVRQQEAANP